MGDLGFFRRASHSPFDPLNHCDRYFPGGIKSTHTACGMVAVLPVAVSRPVAGSTLNRTMLFESRLAQINQLPSGERLKLRGCAPPEEIICTVLSEPSSGWRAKTAMLS